MQVEVEQRGHATGVLAELPCERGRHGRCADAAARPDDHDADMRALDRRFPRLGCVQHRLRLQDGIADLIRPHGLEQIVVQAARDQVAIQPDVVDLAHGDHHGAGLADLGQRVDVIEWIARFRKIDQQDVGACGDRQRLDCIAQAALAALFRRPAHVDRHRAHDVERRLVTDKGRELVAIGRHARFPGCVHCCDPPCWVAPCFRP